MNDTPRSYSRNVLTLVLFVLGISLQADYDRGETAFTENIRLLQS